MFSDPAFLKIHCKKRRCFLRNPKNHRKNHFTLFSCKSAPSKCCKLKNTVIKTDFFRETSEARGK